jgi:hypothetical protein
LEIGDKLLMLGQLFIEENELTHPDPIHEIGEQLGMQVRRP